MRSAACRHDQELNVLFYGECDEVGETQGKSNLQLDLNQRNSSESYVPCNTLHW